MGGAKKWKRMIFFDKGMIGRWKKIEKGRGRERDRGRKTKKTEKVREDFSFIFDFPVNTVLCTCLPTLKSMLPSPSLSNILKSWSRNTSPASPSGMIALNITFILFLSILPSGQSAMKPCNAKMESFGS